MRASVGAAVLLVASGLLCSCKLVRNDPQAARGGRDAYASAYDPNAMVASMWSKKIIPDVERRATDITVLLVALKADADAAGHKYGYRGKDDGAPWNFPTRVHGTIVSVDTDSSQGTVAVDTDGDGKADVIVDIGPTVLGTTLRDSLDFISFADFRNQIDYARFGTALNAYAVAHVMQTIPRAKLDGQTITVTGAFSYDGVSDQPEVVPLAVALGSKS